MNVARLKRQIKRELVQNKKKTAVLATISVVALYFWTPLIVDWIQPEGTTAHPAENSDAPLSAAAPVVIAQPTETWNSNFWIDQLKTIEQNPGLQTGTLIQANRDPFGRSGQALAERQMELANEATLPPQNFSAITPAEAGLSLMGTIIGPKSRIAKIGGEYYQENDIIEIPNGVEPINYGQETNPSINSSELVNRAEFTVVSIERRQVKLSQENNTFILQIQRPQISRDLTLQHQTSSP